MHSRQLAAKDLQKRGTLAQNQSTTSQTETHPHTASKVTPRDSAQSCAFSARGPNEAAHSKCVISVSQIPAPELPADLAAIINAWPGLSAAFRAALKGAVDAAQAVKAEQKEGTNG